jgi:hypothetical protein
MYEISLQEEKAGQDVQKPYPTLTLSNAQSRMQKQHKGNMFNLAAWVDPSVTLNCKAAGER